MALYGSIVFFGSTRTKEIPGCGLGINSRSFRGTFFRFKGSFFGSTRKKEIRGPGRELIGARTAPTVQTAALGPAPARAAQIVTGRPAITGSRRASRAYRWNSTTAVIARRARARALVLVKVAARLATATHAITGS